MINYTYFDKLWNGSTDRQIVIESDDGSITITNSEIHQGKFALEESLCSDSELRFGACEASSMSFTISNVIIPLKGKWLNASLIVDGHNEEPIKLGRFKVDSDKLTSDKRHRDVAAYDAMYDILNADVTEWYNGLTFPTTLKKFRKSFIKYCELEDVDITLVNDDMIVEKTIEPSEISGKDVITAICEINGCFGHINRDGKFEYIILKEIYKGIFPSNTLYPANDLYPHDTNATRINSSRYIKAAYEDYTVQAISKVQIRQEENDIGGYSGEGDNGYAIENNFLVYGKSTEELNEIARNILEVIRVVSYVPIDAELVGNPCFEVGDPIRILTKSRSIDTYILGRQLRGIRSSRDMYMSQGSEYTNQNINSTQKTIVQLKGKTNVLERTVEETKSTITDVESGLQTQIKQNAEEIKAEAVRAKSEEESLRSSLTIEADRIRSEVATSYTTKQETTSAVKNAIDVASADATAKATAAENNAKSETAEKLKSYSTTVEMNSAITQTADSITQSVNKQITETKEYANNTANAAENNAKADTANKLKSYSTTTEMNSAIEQKANSIVLSVNEQISETKEYASQQAQLAYSDAEYYVNYELKAYSTTTEMNSAINVKTDAVIASVDEQITETKTYIDGKTSTLETKLSASIKVNADSIASEVSRATTAEGELSTKITQTESSLTARVNGLNGDVSALEMSVDSISSQISSYDGRFNKIEQTVDGVTFEDENGKTMISGNSITTGTIIGVAVLFDIKDACFWACGTDNVQNAHTDGEWVCDSNALYSHDNYGNRSIELWRKDGRGVFTGDVIADGTSLSDTYDLASSASSAASNAASTANAASSAVESLEKSVASVSKSISSINNDISLMSSDIESLDDSVYALKNSVSSLSARISENEGDISINSKYIRGLEDRLTAVEDFLGL